MFSSIAQVLFSFREIPSEADGYIFPFKPLPSYLLTENEKNLSYQPDEFVVYFITQELALVLLTLITRGAERLVRC